MPLWGPESDKTVPKECQKTERFNKDIARKHPLSRRATSSRVGNFRIPGNKYFYVPKVGDYFEINPRVDDFGSPKVDDFGSPKSTILGPKSALFEIMGNDTF